MWKPAWIPPPHVGGEPIGDRFVRLHSWIIYENQPWTNFGMALLSLLVALDLWYHWRYLCPHIIKRNTLTNWFYDKIMNLFSTAWMFDYSVHSWKRWDPISLGSEETLKNFQEAASSETFLIIMRGVGFPVSDDRQSIIDIDQGVFGHCVSLTFPSGPTITPHTHDDQHKS